MQREIKFRAWHKGTKTMCDVISLDFDTQEVHICLNGACVLTYFDAVIIMQCTGLKDKNGKEIYEWDILRDSWGWVFTVEWDSDNARFLGRHTKSRGDTYICYVGREPKGEIIGNVYEDGDLLVH